MTAKCPDSYFSPEPCHWGKWKTRKDCDVCKEEAKGLTKYAIKSRPLEEGFIYPDVEGFWKGTAKPIGKGPECYSHDEKENFAAKKESWEKILEDLSTKKFRSRFREVARALIKRKLSSRESTANFVRFGLRSGTAVSGKVA